MGPERRRILFVDDDPLTLDGLKRIMRKHRDYWECDFIQSPLTALQFMENHPCDLVVADLVMTEMHGAELLERVAEKWPDSIRFVLSGQVSTAVSQSLLENVHQFHSKPIDSEEFSQQIQKALSARDQCRGSRLREVVSRIKSLPSLPTTYAQIQEMSQREDVSLSKITDIVRQDVGLVAKLLQLVNSSFFSVRQKINDIDHAVRMLGLGNLNSLTLSFGLFQNVKDSNPIPGFSLTGLAAHCIECGTLARRMILDTTKNSQQANVAMVAGVLHDVGTLIRWDQLPEEFRILHTEAKSSGATLHQLELERDGISHAELGGYLLGLWGFERPIVDAVRLHHSPEQISSPTFEASAAVYLANILLLEKNPCISGNGAVPVLHYPLIRQHGLESALSHWRKGISASTG